MPKISLAVVKKGKGYAINSESVRKLQRTLKLKPNENIFNIRLSYKGRSFIPVSHVSRREQARKVKMIGFRGQTDTLESVFGKRYITKKETEQKLLEYVKEKKLEKRRTRIFRYSQITIPKKANMKVRKGTLKFTVSEIPKWSKVISRKYQPIVARRATFISRYLYDDVAELDWSMPRREAIKTQLIRDMFSYNKTVAEVYVTLIFEGMTPDGRRLPFYFSTYAYSTSELNADRQKFRQYIRDFFDQQLDKMVKVLLEGSGDERIVSAMLIRYDVIFQRLTRGI